MGVQVRQKVPRSPCCSPGHSDSAACPTHLFLCPSVHMCLSLLYLLSPSIVSACLHICRSCPHLSALSLSVHLSLGSPVRSDSPACLSHQVHTPSPLSDPTCFKSSLTGVSTTTPPTPGQERRACEFALSNQTPINQPAGLVRPPLALTSLDKRQTLLG